MKYRIAAPETGYTGISAGVTFVDGIGYAEDEERARWFRRKGYAVELLPGQDYIIDGKKIGTVEEEMITITDPDIIHETMDELCAEKKVEASKIQAELEALLKAVGKMKTEELAAFATDRNIDLKDCSTNDLRRERIGASLTEAAQDAQKERLEE